MTTLIPDELRRFVEAQRVARLATVDEAGRPHIVPICFALVEDTLFIAVDEKPKRGDALQLRRLRNIAVNPHVQILFDHYDDVDWSRLRYAQLRGRARVLTPEATLHADAVAVLRQRYSQYRVMRLESLPVIAVEVLQAVGWAAEN